LLKTIQSTKLGFKAVLTQLSSIKSELSVEFVQHLLSYHFSFCLQIPSISREIAVFICELQEHINMPFDVYKKFVIAHALRTMFSSNPKADPDREGVVIAIKTMYDIDFLESDDIMTILYFLSKCLFHDKKLANALVRFSMELRHVLSYSIDGTKIVEVKTAMSNAMKNVDAETKKSLQNVLQIFSWDSIECQATGNQLVSEAFKAMIQKTLNDEMIDEEVQLINHEVELEYFLKFALKSTANAIKFAKVLPTLFHSDPSGGYFFRYQLLHVLASKFEKLHMNTPRPSSSETEKKSISRLVCELACRNYFGNEEMNIFVKNLSEDVIKRGRIEGSLALCQIMSGHKKAKENET
jgi:hypothetical protein